MREQLIDIEHIDLSTQWVKGEDIKKFLPVGILDYSLGIGQLSLEYIVRNSNQAINLEQLTLGDIGFIKDQTVASLLESLPHLEKTLVRDLPFIQDVLAPLVNVSGRRSLKAVLVKHRNQLNVPLTDVVNLNTYGLDALPGLEKQSLNTFAGWQLFTMDQIPGVAEIPLGRFPIPILSGGVTFGYVDVVLNQHQNRLNRSIVGSYQQGFNVPCLQDCPHIEFSHPEWLAGRQWISGKSLEVEGGEGVLGSVNGGMEPAGRHPFGSAFKVVLWDIDEAAGTADTALFFRFCVKKTFIDLGCSPYFIGGFPFIPFEENSWGIL